jgi:hypothetical protein
VVSVEGHKCSPDCWYVAKQNGRMIRMRNRCTGLWDDWMRQPSSVAPVDWNSHFADVTANEEES